MSSSVYVVYYTFWDDFEIISVHRSKEGAERAVAQAPRGSRRAYFFEEFTLSD